MALSFRFRRYDIIFLTLCLITVSIRYITVHQGLADNILQTGIVERKAVEVLFKSKEKSTDLKKALPDLLESESTAPELKEAVPDLLQSENTTPELIEAVSDLLQSENTNPELEEEVPELFESENTTPELEEAAPGLFESEKKSLKLEETTPVTPNFVFVLTDDLDITLGGTDGSSLDKTRAFFNEHGSIFTNWFSQTPLCCPSRAEIKSGIMYHNLRNPHYSSAAGCQHANVGNNQNHPYYQKQFFAKHFDDLLGFTTGIFGKTFNTQMHSGSRRSPPGVDRWLVNDGGDFYNPTFWYHTRNENRDNRVTFNNCTMINNTGRKVPIPCYSTSIIGNHTISWIRDHIKSENKPGVTKKPFFAYISVKAPHIQDGPDFAKAHPAPWYKEVVLPEQSAPRVPNYNLWAPHHHWLVRSQPPISDHILKEVDDLYHSRHLSMLSVDDLVEDLVNNLKDLGILDNTYVIFTSDHGYRFGQFRMPMGKWSPYENDIRVPMMIAGPGIGRGGKANPIMASHVDLMPTLLGLAGHADEPSTMDGRNLAPYILNLKEDQGPQSLLIEYESLGNVNRYVHLEETYNNTFIALRILDAQAPEGQQNIKYVEFIDSRSNWSFNSNPKPRSTMDESLIHSALELELFDLDNDPFEINNLAREASIPFLNDLHEKAMRLLTCKGDTCRFEKNKGLPRYFQGLSSTEVIQ